MSAAAIKAGKGLMRDFGEVDQLQISRKGVSNFVTKSDLRTEKLLQRELAKARPDFGFLLEEGGEVAGKSAEYRWVIDPLDGTSNFIHAIPYFCISIALEKRSKNGDAETVAGVVYDPIHNELFCAEKGKGAFMNSRRMTVSARENPEDAMLVTGNPKPSLRNEQDAFTLFKTVSAFEATIRYFGATALDLANLAAGRIDACWYYTMQPWDVAAGLLLIAEAGGVTLDLEGKPAHNYSKNLLATNRQLLLPMRKMLSKAA
jgi:myo-inositol-1(or 4)-monophosphatase